MFLLQIAPTIPMNLIVKARKYGQLHVTWDPPMKANGNVTHYEVYWRKRELNATDYSFRDYCKTRE